MARRKKCKLCPMWTTKDHKGVPVCSVCDGKYGDKLEAKLTEKGIEFKEENKEEPERAASISYASREDLIQLIANLIISENIDFDEIEEAME